MLLLRNMTDLIRKVRTDSGEFVIISFQPQAEPHHVAQMIETIERMSGKKVIPEFEENIIRLANIDVLKEIRDMYSRIIEERESGKTGEETG